MPATRIRVAPAADDLASILAGLPERLGIDPEFPSDALAEADRSAAHPHLPDADATDLELVTIDPPGSLDLDQALHLERDGGGFLVHYAIADVPAFVPLGGALDRETRRRGQTLYAPDRRIPLHPDSVGQGAASLLPEAVRGAFVWRMRLDASGAVVDTALARARVRSRLRLDYAGVQADLDAGRATGSLGLLREVGEARQAQELRRGGASLDGVEVEVEPDGAGYRLVRRSPLPVEGWNAQLSLLTGMEAARIMLGGGVGILRTMPAPEEAAVDRFRRQTVALGAPWPAGQSYGEYLRALDPSAAHTPAIVHAAAALFRGAAYSAFDGTPPEHPEQSAIAAPYAHVTAPIRRLVDRFGLLVCDALANGREVDAAVRSALPALPAAMASSGALAGRLDRLAVDTVEAAVLSSRVGAIFDAVVLSAGDGRGTVQLLDPAVTAPCTGDLTAGDRVRVRLDSADVSTAEVAFSRV